MDISHHQRVLEDATNKENFLLKLKGTVTETDAGVEAQLNYMKDHFAKLKFNFIELEAKKLFHEFVSEQNVDAAVPNETEAAKIKESKKALKSKKRDMETEISTMIDNTIKAQDQLEHMCHVYASELSELEQLEASYAKLSAAFEEQTKEIGTETNIAAVQAANETMRASIAATEAKIGEQHGALQSTTSQKEAMLKDVGMLEESVAAAKSETRGGVLANRMQPSC